MADSDEEAPVSTDEGPATESSVAHPPSPTLPVADARSFDQMVFDPAEAAYQAVYDPVQDSPMEAVVHAVGAVTDVPTDELEPLYSVVDGDALDAVFSSRACGGERPDAAVTFAYEGTVVTIASSGVVRVTPGTE